MSNANFKGLFAKYNYKCHIHCSKLHVCFSSVPRIKQYICSINPWSQSGSEQKKNNEN